MDKVDKNIVIFKKKHSIYKALRHHQGLVVVAYPKVDKLDKNIHFYSFFLFTSKEKVDIMQYINKK